MNNRRLREFCCLPLLALAAGGCANLDNVVPASTGAKPHSAKILNEIKDYTPPADAGVPVQPLGDPATTWKSLIASHAFTARRDPFSLHPKERAFDAAQAMERVFSSTGGWSVRFVPKTEVAFIPRAEPQPYRRLAGVIVGDSVLALIDMGDGRLELIRPGQMIRGWRVASIDSEKAILRRGGSVMPHEVVVRLESPPFGTPAPGGAPGQAPGQGQPPGTGGTPGRGRAGGGIGVGD